MTPALLPSFDHSTFHRHSLDTLVAKLKSYGNEISSDHLLALSGLCELASLTLAGLSQKRVRFALPCGMGKTTAVRAILQTLHELGLPHRVVVASSKVEELCALKRTLIMEDGIPGAKVGLQHSYPCTKPRDKAVRAGFASEPAGNLEAQFLLVTHANVQSGAERAWMHRCDLLLFDESLIVGEAHCLPLVRNCTASSVFRELCDLEGQAQEVDHDLEPAARAARVLFDQLASSTKELRDSQVGIVRADCVDTSLIREARLALAHRPETYPLTRQLFDWAEQAAELRVFASAKDRTTLITYAVSVPNCLKGVIVLDASDPIRELVHYDFRMERAEDVVPSLAPFRSVPGGLSSIKYHSDVSIHFACDAGGRSKLTASLRDELAPWVLEKLVRLVKSKPNESFLVFTYKAREHGDCDFTRRIIRALVEADVDPDELVPAGPDGEPGVRRVAISTWGREAGTNEYSAYTNVVLLGVMRKPEEAVAGEYLGQVENLRCPRMKSVARILVESECRQSIYQAINRCRMRRVRVVDGVSQAYPCSVYIWHADKHLESKLAPVLGGCPAWRPWREPLENLTAADVAMLIRNALKNLEDSGVVKISCRGLRKLIGYSVGNEMFRRARDLATADQRWTKVRSSLELTFGVPSL